MGLTLRAPSLEDVEQVRLWRNANLEALRTPFPLTQEQQASFYHDVVCDRNAHSRWWSAYSNETLVGFVGLTDIERENGLAELSLILDPEWQGQGCGEEAFELLLNEGFGNLGLQTIYGECYECNPAAGFWRRMVQKHGGYRTLLPRRKRWQGKLYDSLYFSFTI